MASKRPPRRRCPARRSRLMAGGWRPHRRHRRGGSLPPGTSGTLARQGPVGRAVQQLVASSGTNPPAQQGSSGGGSNGQGGSSRQAPSAPTAPGQPSVPLSHGSVPAAGGRGVLSALLHPIVSGSASGGT